MHRVSVESPNAVAKILGLALVFAFALVRPTWAADEPASDDPESIRQEEPSFYVQVAVDRLTRQYREGDPLTVTVTSESDAYAYVLYKQADGKVYQIFPNSDQPDNRVKPKDKQQIPAPRDTFVWTVGAPFGREVLKVVASKKPIEGLSAAELFEGRFNPVPPQAAKAAQEELKQSDPKQWAEDSVEITTYAAAAADPAEPTGRRVGLFVGLSQFRYNDDYRDLTEGKWEPNLPGSAKDATLAAQVMKELSRLDETKVLTDEQATKAGIEEAVTSWLPSVSKPGDTVFIYIETHGDGIDDDNGDEPDGKDEYFMTYDYADLSLVGHFAKQDKAGTLAPDKRPLLESFRTAISKNRGLLAKSDAKSQAKLLNLWLVHRTAVTDDLFGHWLQSLAGRKVVVMMATCHAGGFAVNEKGLRAPESPPPSARAVEFDFLTGELGRLKDIGQPDSVVITACTTAQISYQARLRPELIAELRRQTGADLPVGTDDFIHTLPYGLIESLAASPPRQPIDAAFRDIHARVMKFVSTTSQAGQVSKNSNIPVRHEPQFYNFSSRPIYLKP